MSKAKKKPAKGKRTAKKTSKRKSAKPKKKKKHKPKAGPGNVVTAPLANSVTDIDGGDESVNVRCTVVQPPYSDVRARIFDPADPIVLATGGIDGYTPLNGNGTVFSGAVPVVNVEPTNPPVDNNNKVVACAFNDDFNTWDPVDPVYFKVYDSTE
jgi:hypothetical protein